ncbi:MAG: ogt [Rickettsiaceae bacterium]|jgi:O-6-methylguanine DNA methyltransferase|nr:ogt [Rickettsiaceae bacterium]
MHNLINLEFSTITLTPQEFARHLKDSKVKQYRIKIPAGILEISATERSIFKAELIDNYPILTLQTIEELPKSLLLIGSDFQIKVWQATLNIPFGYTKNYHELAREITYDKSYRAVANALGRNNIIYLIPCHRVIRKNGAIGGFTGGVEVKAALLAAECEELGRRT